MFAALLLSSVLSLGAVHIQNRDSLLIGYSETTRDTGSSGYAQTESCNSKIARATSMPVYLMKANSSPEISRTR